MTKASENEYVIVDPYTEKEDYDMGANNASSGSEDHDDNEVADIRLPQENELPFMKLAAGRGTPRRSSWIERAASPLTASGRKTAATAHWKNLNRFTISVEPLAADSDSSSTDVKKSLSG